MSVGAGWGQKAGGRKANLLRWCISLTFGYCCLWHICRKAAVRTFLFLLARNFLSRISSYPKWILKRNEDFFFPLPCILHRCEKFVSLEQPPESALPNMQIYQNMQLQQIHPSPSSEAVPVWHWHRSSDGSSASIPYSTAHSLKDCAN